MIDGIHPIRKDGNDYEKDMREHYLLVYLAGLAEAVRQAGDSTSAWLEAVRNYTAQWEMAKDVPADVIRRWQDAALHRHSYNFIRQFARKGIDIRPIMNDANIERTLRGVVDDNIKLIRKLPGINMQGLAQRFHQAEKKAPMDQKDRERLFREQARVTGYRLRRITRDQNNKLYGKLSEIRQTDAGIARYKWSTSRDDRVRATHVEKNGKIFAWGAPPQDTGHPGHDIQCRCVAIPDISLEELQARFGA